MFLTGCKPIEDIEVNLDPKIPINSFQDVEALEHDTFVKPDFIKPFITAKQQSRSNLCWAAVTEMVSEVPQCAIAAKVFGLSEEQCCNTSLSYSSTVCNRTYNTSKAFEKSGILSQQIDGSISEEQLKFELANNRPVEISLRSEDAIVGHAILAVGYSTSGIAIADPRFPNLFWYRYDRLLTDIKVSGITAKWHKTIYQIQN